MLLQVCSSWVKKSSLSEKKIRIALIINPPRSQIPSLISCLSQESLPLWRGGPGRCVPATPVWAHPPSYSEPLSTKMLPSQNRPPHQAVQSLCFHISPGRTNKWGFEWRIAAPSFPPTLQTSYTSKYYSNINHTKIYPLRLAETRFCIDS